MSLLSTPESFSSEILTKYLAFIAAQNALKQQYDNEATEIATAELNGELAIFTAPCPIHSNYVLYHAISADAITITFDYYVTSDNELFYQSDNGNNNFGKWTKDGWDVFINQYHNARMKEQG